MKNKEEKKVIVIKETDEMRNWLHPQTKERKQKVLEAFEKVKQQFKEKNL